MPRSFPPELEESVVVDPEVVRDLVEERLLDRARESAGVRIGTCERPAEERDLARDRHVVHTPARPRDPLVEAVETGGSDRAELLRRRLFLDDDRDGRELVGE